MHRLPGQDASRDTTKVDIGGWIAALGNVIGYYDGVRSRQWAGTTPRALLVRHHAPTRSW